MKTIFSRNYSCPTIKDGTENKPIKSIINIDFYDQKWGSDPDLTDIKSHLNNDNQ